ncbi:MAG: SUMF1/EgtB/PvdO family nonheme iron enzyme [Candidatus Cloacimonetes bacterium]|nr:SUMF1/EgtB/PvdO family nonheme iron enzyme [Candidatus Cloacimonadota bacterium]
MKKNLALMLILSWLTIPLLMAQIEGLSIPGRSKLQYSQTDVRSYYPLEPAGPAQTENNAQTTFWTGFSTCGHGFTLVSCMIDSIGQDQIKTTIARQSYTFNFPSSTPVFEDGHPISFRDLKKGDRITVSAYLLDPKDLRWYSFRSRWFDSRYFADTEIDKGWLRGRLELDPAKQVPGKIEWLCHCERRARLAGKVLGSKGPYEGENPKQGFRDRQTILKAIGENMVRVPGGSYQLWKAEALVVQPYYISKYEVSADEYKLVMNQLPYSSNSTVGNYPVRGISWYDSIEFCNLLSIMMGLDPCYSYEGHGPDPGTWPQGWRGNEDDHVKIILNPAANGYRLPGNSEWLIAFHGATHTWTHKTFSQYALDRTAWHAGNSSGTIHTIGSKAPNELGLYDMLGNVFEYVFDIMNVEPDPRYPTLVPGVYRTAKGDDSNSKIDSSYLSTEIMINPTSTYRDAGFRLARNAEQ